MFELNVLDLASLQLQFSNNVEATLFLNLEGQDLIWPFALDGNYHVEPNGQALRGYWSDPQTFSFDIYEDKQEFFQLHVTEEGVLLETLCLIIKGKEVTPQL